MRLALRISSLLAALSFATAASAAIIIGNLASFTNDSGTASGIAGATTLGGYSNKGIGFTMGGTAYSVSSLTLRLTAFDTVNANDRPSVSIWINNAGVPGTVVGTFTNPATFNGATATNYVFTPASSMTLSIGSSYFVVVQQLNAFFSGVDNSFQWLNGSPTVTPTGIATMITAPGARFGTTANPTGMSGTSSNYNWFQLEGTAIPEPSAYAAFAGVAADLPPCAWPPFCLRLPRHRRLLVLSPLDALVMAALFVSASPLQASYASDLNCLGDRPVSRLKQSGKWENEPNLSSPATSFTDFDGSSRFLLAEPSRAGAPKSGAGE